MSQYEVDEYGQPYYEDPLQAAYDADPVGTTTQIAAAAAQQAAYDAATQAQTNHGYVVASQAALAATSVDREMTEAHGAAWENHRDEVVELLQQHPNLLPDERNFLDPSSIRQSFEHALTIAREVSADEYVSNRWTEIMGSRTRKLGL
jgi:hypothetical protein